MGANAEVDAARGDANTIREEDFFHFKAILTFYLVDILVSFSIFFKSSISSRLF